MLNWIWLALVVLVPFLIASFAAFDSLVKWEYANHRAEWDADGRPGGFFFRPPGLSYVAQLRSGLATKVLSLKWLFVTPGWARADPRARQLLRRLRLCTLIWNAGVIAAAAGALMLAARGVAHP